MWIRCAHFGSSKKKLIEIDRRTRILFKADGEEQKASYEEFVGRSRMSCVARLLALIVSEAVR